MKETRDIIPAPLRDATEIERVFEPQIVPTGRYPSYRNAYTGDGLQVLDYWRAIRKRLWLVLGSANDHSPPFALVLTSAL